MAQQKYQLHLELWKDNQKLSYQDSDIEYKTTLGKIDGQIYYSPPQPGNEVVSILYRPTQTRMPLSWEIVAPTAAVVNNQSDTATTCAVAANPKQEKLKNEENDAALIPSALKSLQCPDTDTVLPQADSSPKETIPVTATTGNYPTPNYLTCETARFSLQVPGDWKTHLSQLSISAVSPSRSSHVRGEVRAASLPCLDFLDADIVRLFLPQKEKLSRRAVRYKEDDIELGGEVVRRVVFDNYPYRGESFWWIFLKKPTDTYLLVLRGNQNFIYGDEKLPHQILQSFRFKKFELPPSGNWQMPQPSVPVSCRYFTISVPATWTILDITGGILKGISKEHQAMVALSNAHHQGRPMTLFLIAHRQQEVNTLDLALLLTIFRHMLIKEDPLKPMEEKEKDIALKHGQAKVLELEMLSSIPQKSWLVVSKHQSIIYGIFIQAPTALWEANAEVVKNILDSFNPVAAEK